MLVDLCQKLLIFDLRCPDTSMKPHFRVETDNKFVLYKFYSNLELKERLLLMQEMIVFFCGQKLQHSCNLKYVI